MALTFFHSKMFDVGNLPVLTSGNCVLKTSRVIKWPLKLRTLLKWFLRPKTGSFYVFLTCCTRFLERWSVCVGYSVSNITMWTFVKIGE